MDGLDTPQRRLPLEDVLRREVRFEPGYDYRDDPEKSKYGCHGLSIRFLLHGMNGAVQFLIYTHWLPSWVGENTFGKSVKSGIHVNPPMGADFGRHWDYPFYPDEELMQCEERSSGQCYYDGSSLNADHLLGILITEGSEAVWESMDAYYRDLTTRRGVK